MTPSTHRAFSLTEVVVVTLLLAIIAGITLPRFVGHRADSYDRDTTVRLYGVDVEVARVAAANGGTLPDDDAEMAARMQVPNLTFTAGASATDHQVSIISRSATEAVAAMRSGSGHCYVLRIPLDAAVAWGRSTTQVGACRADHASAQNATSEDPQVPTALTMN